MCHHGRQVAAIARPASQAAPPPMHMVTSTNTPSDCSSVRNSRREKCIGSEPAFEVGRLYLLLFEQFTAASAKRDQPIDHDIAAVRQIERMERVLLHQEYSKALFAVELPDRTEDLPGNERRQSERRLVQQEQTRSPHQSARDRQHLLL